jgi:putative hydrolase of the HAD superfamily
MRAVLFDYGDVLCRPNPAAHQSLLEIAGVDSQTFEQHYWHDRHEYDLGRFDGPEFWRRFGNSVGRTFTSAQLQALVENDVRMWTTRLNEPMLAWTTALQGAGFATAILSNMPFEISHHMRREFGWLARFTQLTFSCELGLAKPDPAIYIFTCERIGVPPQEVLFLDDKQGNVDAALGLGLHSLVFRNVAQLRRDLEAGRQLQGLPAPDEGSASDDQPAEPELRA